MLFTADAGFFLLVFCLGICVEVEVYIIATPPHSPLTPSLFCRLPTILSLIQMAVIWKLV